MELAAKKTPFSKFMKISLRAIPFLLFVLIGIGIYHAWRIFPIITGFGAKSLCSCAFVSARSEEDILKKELSVFPISIGLYHVDYADSSASGSILGLASRKAIFRRGVGCTLVVNADEKQLRQDRTRQVAPPDSIKDLAWPDGEKVSQEKIAEVKYDSIREIVRQSFDDPSGQRNLRALIVLYDGQIVEEKYAEGYDASTKLAGWSMSKSVLNGILGAYLAGTNQSIESIKLPDSWSSDARRDIKLMHLLHSTSGLEWEENYKGPSWVTRMLYAQSDMGDMQRRENLFTNPVRYFSIPAARLTLFLKCYVKALATRYTVLSRTRISFTR